jgi:hypothetical protein
LMANMTQSRCWLFRHLRVNPAIPTKRVTSTSRMARCRPAKRYRRFTPPIRADLMSRQW